MYASFELERRVVFYAHGVTQHHDMVNISLAILYYVHERLSFFAISYIEAPSTTTHLVILEIVQFT